MLGRFYGTILSALMPYQCWQCGRRTNQVVRTNVFTGWSIGRGGPRAYNHRVNLCPDCVAVRRRNLWRLLLIVGGVIVTVFLVTIIVAVVQFEVK